MDRIGGKLGENGVQNKWQRGCQVGAFSVFGRGYTGNPVQIWWFLAYFSENGQT